MLYVGNLGYEPREIKKQRLDVEITRHDLSPFGSSSEQIGKSGWLVHTETRLVALEEIKLAMEERLLAIDEKTLEMELKTLTEKRVVLDKKKATLETRGLPLVRRSSQWRMGKFPQVRNLRLPVKNEWRFMAYGHLEIPKL
ncbi:hypothetical protein V491_02926 [Pseudogymnoascus sp. VKM F-3775]|nr:hypothetical protein V491_02926 [Pseudogymnoascus sp. VKM F-3775]